MTKVCFLTETNSINCLKISCMRIVYAKKHTCLIKPLYKVKFRAHSYVT